MAGGFALAIEPRPSVLQDGMTGHSPWVSPARIRRETTAPPRGHWRRRRAYSMGVGRKTTAHSITSHRGDTAYSMGVGRKTTADRFVAGPRKGHATKRSLRVAFVSFEGEAHPTLLLSQAEPFRLRRSICCAGAAFVPRRCQKGLFGCPNIPSPSSFRAQRVLCTDCPPIVRCGRAPDRAFDCVLYGDLLLICELGVSPSVCMPMSNMHSALRLPRKFSGG